MFDGSLSERAGGGGWPPPGGVFSEDGWVSDEVLDALTAAAADWDWDNEPPRLPKGLDSWAPSPALGAVLASIEVDRLSEGDRVTVLRARQRMIAHHEAHSYRAMTAIADGYRDLSHDPPTTTSGDDGVGVAGGRDPEVVWWGAAAEIRAALRWTRRTAESELGLAEDLRVRLPRVWETLASGGIDTRRAWLFVHHTTHLSVARAREVTAPLVGEAHRWTTGQLAQRLRQACIDQDPDDARHRHHTRLAQRRVTTAPSPDGTIDLYGLDLPAPRVSEALDRINRIARRLHSDGETRSMDQLRADVLLDLLCGTPHPTTGSIHLTVDLPTLAQLADHPGHLAGYGPVIADIARHTTATLGPRPWTYTVTHPHTDQPLTTGTTRRRPTTTQRRQIQARYPVCQFPGCRMPAHHSDLDHRTPYTDTPHTHPDNLAPLCRHDHHIRHQTGWTYTPTPQGDHHWTSPLGRTYTTSGRDP